MKKLFTLLLLSLLYFFPGSSSAEFPYYYQPQTMVGGDLALFRISLDQFEDVYDGRWGPSYGGFAGVRVFSAHYLLFRYRSFQKDGKADGSINQSGVPLELAHWDEQWYTIGLRIHPPITKRFSSYYGFGIAFYDVEEANDISVFGSISGSEKSDDLGSGFYLEIGLEYFIVQRLASFFEMEVSSGGIRGKTGFEAMSVGGFRFALGVSLFPF